MRRLLWLYLLFATSLALAQPQHPRPGPALPMDFSRIDAHALAAPPAVEKDVDTLARYLTRPATQDVQRIRAIYRWVSDRIAYDTNAFFSHKYPSGEPQNTLSRRMAICDGYSRLIYALGKAAGLDVEIVRGMAKGYSIAVKNKENHAWNAVRLNRGWYLLDSCWGAGSVGKDQVFSKHFDPYYFFTEPSQLASSHFPTDSRWQLLAKAVNQESFLAVPQQWPEFFRLGLKLRSHPQNPVAMKTARLSLEFEAPLGVQLLAEIWQGDAKLARNYTLVRRIGGSLWVDVVSPGPGQYVLHLYGKQTGQTQFQGVLDYDLEVASPVQAACPRASDNFQDCQARLIAPQVGELQRGLQTFELEVPGAETVFLQSRDKLLNKQNQHFQGQFEVQPGTVSLFASFPGGQPQDILTYIVR